MSGRGGGSGRREAGCVPPRATNGTSYPAPRVYGWLLRAYPAAVRSEYGAEILDLIGELRSEPEYSGLVGGLRLWLRMGPDLVRSGARARLEAMRRGGAAGGGRAGAKSAAGGTAPRPPYGGALLAGLAVWMLYALTLAPTTAFWDAGEYITAAHTLGIPHPPGNPLFVLLAHGWDRLLAPLGLPVAVRINLFAATTSAAAHVLWYLVADRLLRSIVTDGGVRRLGAVSAVLLSATSFTVWSQSNVNEKVYTLSLLTAALVSWIVLRWRDAGRPGAWLVALAFVVGLSATNHLMGVLVVPGVLVFLLLAAPRVLLRWRLWLSAGLAGAAALSVYLFLPLRAAERPVLAEGDPRCESVAAAVGSIYTWGTAGCDALSESLTRAQYGKPPITSDPTVWPEGRPRAGALVRAQLLNYAQYFDWQWARSLAGSDPVLGGARPLLTLLFLLLGAVGARAVWRRDRPAGAYVVALLVTFSIGLVAYLNFEYGYSIGYPEVADPEMHEVRERDYFFLISFSVWGVLAGCGLAVLAQRLAGWLGPSAQTAHASRLRVLRAPRLAAAVFSLALLPLSLNWTWASRADDWAARDWAYNLLMSVDPYGVVFTNGDNDTFPLWYLQEVEGLRRDVTVMVTSYLNTPWYVKQLRDLTRPCPAGVSARDAPSRIVCQRQYRGAEMPAALLEAGVPRSVNPPPDSAVPLTDDQIDRIATSYFIAPEPLAYEAGSIRTAIPAGTQMLPADTFVAAIVQATLGRRPIHFLPASPAIEKLGLTDYAVRSGLTLRIHDGAVEPASRDGLARIVDVGAAPVLGAWVDLARTDTLIDRVFRVRGRLLDPDAIWADAPSGSILQQYAMMHLAAAWAHDGRGESARAERHLERAAWWRERASQ